jgi:hypothetical protein
MKAGDVKLGKIFANDHQNVIPLFQRPYVWDQDPNWRSLWSDVREAAEEVEAEAALGEAAGREPRTYFLGAIVLQQRWRAPRRLSSSHIVDGQQRLTTMQILIAAARAVAAGLGAAGVAGRFSSLVENRNETVDEEFPDDRFKVWPLPQDREAYLWAVRAPDDSSPSPDDRHRLTRARAWFEQEITEWAKSADEAVARLDHLHETLNDRMQVVQINLDQRDDPQVIFEALNHRGVRLDAADLVKNLLFQRVEAQGDHAVADELLTKSWLPFDASPWRDKITTGRITRVLVDLLLAYWLTITTRREVLVEHLFVDFKHWLDESGARAAEVIKDLRDHADTYQRMLRMNEHDSTAQLLDRMATVSSTPWPVLLYLHANHAVPQAQRDLAARAIDSYVMRRAICGWTTKDYNRLFLQVTVAAEEAPAEAAGQAVVDTLASQTADSRIWPRDTDFIRGLLRPDLYLRVNRAQLRALLVGMENHLRTGKTEPQPLLKSADSRLSIEHLIPQKWEQHWPLAADDDEHRARRLNTIHQLGNLTLATSKLNPSISNKAWAEKREQLKSHSLLRLTTATLWTVPEGINEWDTDRWTAAWDEQRAELRTMWLARHALRAWPAPPEVADREDTLPVAPAAPNAIQPAVSSGATGSAYRSAHTITASTEPSRKTAVRLARESAFPNGERLYFDPARLSSDRAGPVTDWIADNEHRGAATVDWQAPRDYLVWDADGHHYSPTGLTERIVDLAISKGHLGSFNGALCWHDARGVYLTDVG